MSGLETDESQFWLRLDNAAKIYPAVKNRNLTSVFRSSVELKEKVRAREFLEAVHAIEDRFPYYKVKLKKGFFWYYLEFADLPIPIMHDHGIPCRAFGKNDLMFRLLVKDRTISVEFSHILTDGHGALLFLRSLLNVYLEKCGIRIPEKEQICRPGEVPSREEYEDAYKRYFTNIRSRIVKFPYAFNLPFRISRPSKFNVLTAIIPIEAIIKEAKAYKVSATEYLAAVYLFSLQTIFDQQSQIQKRVSRKTVRLLIPVNLRSKFPTRTMRNFSLYVLPGIDKRLGNYTFHEIAKIVHHQMRLETDKKLISKLISRNVRGEKNPVIRGIPLFAKSLFLARMYTINARQYSGVLSNLGKIDLGETVNRSVSKLIFIAPPPNKFLKVNCAVAGFEDRLIVTFGNISESNVLERNFITFLTAKGIRVRISQPFNYTEDDNV